MKKLPALLIILITIQLSACLAPTTRQVKLDQHSVDEERRKQQEMALTYLQRLNHRLADTAWPLLTSSLIFCDDDQISALGALTISEFHYSEGFRDTAKDLFGLHSSLQITHIIDQGPAASAGLRQGDVLWSINGEKLPDSKEATTKLREQLKLKPGSPLQLTVKRNDELLDIELQPQLQCDFPVTLSESDAVNAYADGSQVVITKGMMKFAQTDQELSLVISHEIAHNVMSHITSKTINSLGGTLLDIIAVAATGVSTQGLFGKLGAQMYSQEFESEADYVGLYIMARAGQDTAGAEQFWRRMAVEHPASINSNHASAHPATAERFISIETTVKQINSKIATGEELLPDMK